VVVTVEAMVDYRLVVSEVIGISVVSQVDGPFVESTAGITPDYYLQILRGGIGYVDYLHKVV